jgi:hypothetical protein
VIQVPPSVAVAPQTFASNDFVKIIGERVANDVIVAREISPYSIAEPPIDGSRFTIQGRASSATSGSDFKITGLPVQTSASTVLIDPIRFAPPSPPATYSR